MGSSRTLTAIGSSGTDRLEPDGGGSLPVEIGRRSRSDERRCAGRRARGEPEAQELDAASASALAATLQLLQDPAQRGAVIGGNPQAAAVDQQMQTILSTREIQEEFYALAAAIVAEVVQGSGGDAAKISQALAAGQADPASFVARLSPQTAERLRTLAGKLQKR
jgi:hypothetical protein